MSAALSARNAARPRPRAGRHDLARAEVLVIGLTAGPDGPEPSVGEALDDGDRGGGARAPDGGRRDRHARGGHPDPGARGRRRRQRRSRSASARPTTSTPSRSAGPPARPPARCRDGDRATTLSALDLACAPPRGRLPRAPTRSPRTSPKSAPGADATARRPRRAPRRVAADQGRQGRAARGRARSPRPSPPPATSSTPRPTTCSRPSSRPAPQALGTEAGLEVEVLDEKALAKGGYGGILGVGKGSSRPPRLVRISYYRRGPKGPRRSRSSARASPSTPAASPSSRPPSMEHMTSDMGGAAAVIATVVLAAQAAGCRSPSTAYGADGGEHAVGTAYRPGDVLTQYGGTTVEVHQHRRRGPADPGRRDRAGLRGRARLPDRDVDADRRADGRAGQPHPRRDGHRRVPRPGRRISQRGRRERVGDAAARRAARGPGLPGRRPRQRHQRTAAAACSRPASSCGSSSPTACSGRTSTSPGRPSTPAARSGYTAQGRHRRAGADDDRGARGHRRQRLGDWRRGCAPFR